MTDGLEDSGAPLRTDGFRYQVVSQNRFATGGYGDVLTAVLGSCVAVCLHDPWREIGGLSHLMVPASAQLKCPELWAGINLIELQINALMAQGASRHSLQAKIFGGAEILGMSRSVGPDTVAFTSQYLSDEDIPVISEDLGGDRPRSIHVHPDSFCVRLRRVPSAELMDDLHAPKPPLVGTLGEPLLWTRGRVD